MINKFSVKNFRIFDEKGFTFEFSPVTILTGTNGAGKSSLTKALMLLQDFFDQGFQDMNDKRSHIFDPTRYKLDFTKPELKMGGFSSELNRNAERKAIGFSYTATSGVAPLAEFTVEYWFKSRDDDSFKRGWLSSLVVKDSKDELIMKASVRKDGSLKFEKLNLDCGATMTSFMRFYAIANYKHLEWLQDFCYNINGELEDIARYDLLEEKKSEFQSAIDSLGPYYEVDVDGAERLFESLANGHDNAVKSAYPHLFDETLLTSWKKCSDECIMFYFPLLEQFKGLTKKQSCDLLRRASFIIETGHITYTELSNSFSEEIIADFEKSPFDSFVDYYREKENQKFEDFSDPRPFITHLSDTDIIRRIKYEAKMVFDANYTIPKEGVVDFNKLYRFMSSWQWKLTPGDDDFISRTVDGNFDYYSSSHKLYSAYREYLGILLLDILLPKSFTNIHYVGNSHTAVKRLYSFDDKSDLFMQRIEKYLDAKREFEATLDNKDLWTQEREPFRPGDFINSWIDKLELGKSLVINIDEDSLGVKLFLKKDEEGTLVSLADEGYGVNQIIAILLCIETEILNLKTDLIKNERIPVMGQREPAPYIQEPVTVIIEEPEVNLHPAFQSKLAELFYEATSMFKGNTLQFIIETHSEYMIRKAQVMLLDKNYSELSPKKNVFAIYYIGKDHAVKKMEFDEDGSFTSPFGTGFFDEADNLAMNLMLKNVESISK